MNSFIKHVQEQFKLVTAFIAAFPLLLDYFSTGVLGLNKTEIIITGILCFLTLNALFSTREIFFKKEWLIIAFSILAFSVIGFILPNSSINNSFENPAIVLAKIFSYLLFTSGGILILLYGFVKEERNNELIGKIQSLEADKQKFIVAFVDSISQLRNTNVHASTGAPRSKLAFHEGTSKIFEEILKTSNKLSKGTIEIRGSAMDEIYKRFLDKVTNTFKALSFDDLNYWTSEESKQYFRYNKALIQNGIIIERIFLLSKDFRYNLQAKKVIQDQIDIGVTVRIAMIHKINELNISDEVRVLDFGIFDDFAVSFWHKSNGRLFRVVTSSRVCSIYQNTFILVKDHCEQIPGKKEKVNIFESIEDWELWIAKDKNSQTKK